MPETPEQLHARAAAEGEIAIAGQPGPRVGPQNPAADRCDARVAVACVEHQGSLAELRRARR